MTNLKLVTPHEQTQFTHHPLADVFPMMTAEAAKMFADDIEHHGQRDPIVVTDTLILDGRERYRACLSRGIQPRFEEWDGQGSVIDFIISKNLQRRHLNTPQRAMVAARVSNLKDGQRADEMKKIAAAGKPAAGFRFDPVTVVQAAERFNVSRDSVNMARQIIENCQPQEITAVDDGELSLKRAHRSIAVRTTLIAGKPEKKKTLSLAGKNPERIAKQKVRLQVWKNFRTAMEALNELPMPADVVPIVRALDRSNILRTKLPVALAWLTEFDKCQ